ncbi:MAG: hypothetical protein DWQ58_18610 [Microcystis aeruginosa TA09]|nr:MAG: hypothetical protein DWQ58_18610 [Microcystis aeruginosa TA09]
MPKKRSPCPKNCSFPKRSPLLIIKKRSPLAFLSQAMAILNLNQQDNSDRTSHPKQHGRMC